MEDELCQMPRDEQLNMSIASHLLIHFHFVSLNLPSCDKASSLAHDRMVVTLNNIVNSFRNEFDCGPWVRASQSQIREIEALLADADCVPPEPAPASSSANS